MKKEKTKTVKVFIRNLENPQWDFEIEEYTSLRDFVTSVEFLEVTITNPNKLTFLVNGSSSEDDLLLVPGDTIEILQTGEKAIIRPAGLIKKLKKEVGLKFDRHGGNHDHWTTDAGRKVIFPRHANKLKTGTLKSILKQSGIEGSIDEFLAKK